MTLKILTIMGALALAACQGESEKSSDILVTNGRQISTDDYPEVVKINIGGGFCTASYISPRVLLSAAHCVKGKSFPADLKVMMHPLYGSTGDANRVDLAIIAFPEDKSAKSVSLSSIPAKAGDPITIVGFGRVDAEGTEAGIKRVGQNTLTNRQQGLLVFTGVVRGENDGVESASARGDSGGPMFVNGQLVGVTSAGSVRNGMKFSMYVDLHSQDSKDFFRQVIAAGIDLNLPNGYL